MNQQKTYCCEKEACWDDSPIELEWRPIRGRIAMVSMHTCPLTQLGSGSGGGMNVYVREISRELGRRGWAVDIFTHAQSVERPFVIPMAQNVRVIHVQAGPIQYIGKNELYQYVPEFSQNIIEMAVEENLSYDAIYSHYWLSGLVSEQLRAEWGAPMIQMFHTLGMMKNRVAQRKEDRELDIRIASEKHIMEITDRLIAANPIDRQHMLDLYEADPCKIEIVPCGVDLSLFRPYSPSEAREELEIATDKKLVVFVGRIDPLKGVDTLIRAMNFLVKEKPAWRKQLMLGIVGGNPEHELEGMNAEMRRLRALREELGLHDVVKFLGAQDQEALPYFYAAADVVSVPSHYESFGLVALEATACGTPVIASEVGGLTYTLRDRENSFLIPPHRPDILANRIMTLLENPWLRARMGQEGIKRAQRFGWSSIAGQIVSTIRHLTFMRTVVA